ncbi:SIMPL domain-containing protein [Microbacterium koreense]|uniref:SIMPL domain-containing protein n=1 Tax=Microbacterium koreense TaxID=323761 RepID=A0ABW2ZRG8_9MICO
MSEVTITVRGEHEARVAPEEGIAQISVRTEGHDRGDVVERIASLATPIREDLAARAAADEVTDWSSQRVSLWANRPWNSEGKQLSLVHYASVEMTATFTDFAALSWWVSNVAERDGVQIDGISWRLTPATAARVEADVAAHAVRVAVQRAQSYADALDLGAVIPLEIADTGLLVKADAGAGPEMRLARAAFAADTGAGGPALEFEPEDIVVSAAVEARFTARAH